jgi:hypothetical protein
MSDYIPDVRGLKTLSPVIKASGHVNIFWLQGDFAPD